MAFNFRPSIAAVVAAVLMMAACTTNTPYQPLSMLSPISGGYTDERLGQDRYRVVARDPIRVEPLLPGRRVRDICRRAVPSSLQRLPKPQHKELSHD